MLGTSCYQARYQTRAQILRMEENRRMLSDLNIFNQQSLVIDIIHWAREGQRDKDKMFGVKFQDGDESK